MRGVRGLLLASWLVLIASLMWDPLTPALTAPENVASPFHIGSPGMAIQGGTIYIKNEPYPMGRRIFWTMLVPIVPLFLMVLGHEAWRRVCPLSFASQLPRLLQLGRTRKSVKRSTGKVERKLTLLSSDSWLARNSWYVQFGLLFLGLSSRLLFANASSVGLAFLLLGIIGSSVLVGFLFGGKSWCHYVCPINVVQKIYTEPRGLLESQAHIVRIPITQSMCRQSTPEGEKPRCVGCVTSCPDVDLERSYWDAILLPARRHVYYMFFGLIIGFYGYYYLYSGTWDYYFSGIWTHEANPAQHLFDPGFYVFDRPWPIIKLVAAPLTLAVACGASLGLGMALEAGYKRLRNLRAPTTDGEIRHHCLTACSFICINTFYFFGGRPNIMLMPHPVIRVIDLLIVALTTLWLLQALQRSPMKYRREGMSAYLLSELKKLKVNVSRYLDGRGLDELKPDEVYVLTKVLPAFSHEQKLQAYGRVLDEAIVNGTTASPATLRLLGEMRTQMDISDQEHLQLLDRVAAGGSASAEVKKASFFEQAVNLAKYQEIMGHAVANHIESGKTLADALVDPDILVMMPVLRASFQVTAEESESSLQTLVETDGVLFARLQRQLDALKDLLSCRFFLNSRRTASPMQQEPVAMLLERLGSRKRAVLLRMLSLLRALQNHEVAQAYARCLVRLDAQTLAELLPTPADAATGVSWEDALAPPMTAILRGQARASGEEKLLPPGLSVYTFHDVINGGLDAAACFKYLMQDDDQVVEAVALSVAARISADLGKELLATIESASKQIQHPLLVEVKNMIEGRVGPDASHSEARARPLLDITVKMPDGRAETRVFSDKTLAVGSGLTNDLMVSSEFVAPYHFRLNRTDDGRVEIEMLLTSSPLFLDGQACTEDSRLLDSPARIEFCRLPARGPELLLRWNNSMSERVLHRIDGVTKLMWLRSSGAFGALSWSKQAKIALQTEARRYSSGEKLRVGTDEVYIMVDGSLVNEDGKPSGRLLMCDVNLDGDDRPRAFRVDKDFALVLCISEPEHVLVAKRCAGQMQPPPAASSVDALPVASTEQEFQDERRQS